MAERDSEEESRANPATQDQSQGRREEARAAPAPQLEEPGRKNAEKQNYEGIITFGAKTELVRSLLGTALQQVIQDLTAIEYYHAAVVLRPCSEVQAQRSQLPLIAPQLLGAHWLARRKILLILRHEEEQRLLRERQAAELSTLGMEEAIAGKEGFR